MWSPNLIVDCRSTNCKSLLLWESNCKRLTRYLSQQFLCFNSISKTFLLLTGHRIQNRERRKWGSKSFKSYLFSALRTGHLKHFHATSNLKTALRNETQDWLMLVFRKIFASESEITIQILRKIRRYNYMKMIAFFNEFCVSIQIYFCILHWNEWMQ